MSFLNELKLSLESQSTSLKENEYSNLSMETLCNDIRYLAYSEPSIEYFGISTEGVKEFAKKTVEVIRNILKWIKEKVRKFLSMIIGFFSKIKPIDNEKERLLSNKVVIDAVYKAISEQTSDITSLSKNKNNNRIIMLPPPKEELSTSEKIKISINEYDLKYLLNYGDEIPLNNYALVADALIASFKVYSNYAFGFFNKDNKDDLLDSVKSYLKNNLNDFKDISIGDLNNGAKLAEIVDELVCAKTVEKLENGFDDIIHIDKNLKLKWDMPTFNNRKYLKKGSELLGDENSYHIAGNIYCGASAYDIFKYEIGLPLGNLKEYDTTIFNGEWGLRVTEETNSERTNKNKKAMEYNIKGIDELSSHVDKCLNELKNMYSDSEDPDDKFMYDFKSKLTMIMAMNLEKASSSLGKILSEYIKYITISTKIRKIIWDYI